jgi:hypothetical protein
MPAMESNQQAKKLILAILIVLVAVIAIAIVVAAKRARTAEAARHATLPDGTTVELLGTAVGNATFTTETKWQGTLRRYLPGRWLKWLPAISSGSCSSSSNSVTVYLRVTNPRLTASSSLPWYGYRTEDETGFNYSQDGGNCSFGGTAGNQVYGLSLRAYPRRQRNFLFQLLDVKGAVVGSLRVPNPVSGKFPDWKPLPLPQTQTNGPVALTLRGLEERGDSRWRYLNLNSHVESASSSWEKARARIQLLQDSTGNEGSMLSRRELAWKVQVFVFRERLQDFAANEQLVVSNLTLPTSGNFSLVNQSAICGGVSVKVLVLAGAGQLTITNGVQHFMLPPSPGSGSGHSTYSTGTSTVESWSSNDPFLLVEANNCQANDEVEFHLHDDQGREIKVNTNGYQGGGVRKYNPTYNPPGDAKFVTLTIVVNRPLPFEFMVNPADVQVNNH